MGNVKWLTIIIELFDEIHINHTRIELHDFQWKAQVQCNNFDGWSRSKLSMNECSLRYNNYDWRYCVQQQRRIVSWWKCGKSIFPMKIFLCLYLAFHSCSVAAADIFIFLSANYNIFIQTEKFCEKLLKSETNVFRLRVRSPILR